MNKKALVNDQLMLMDSCLLERFRYLKSPLRSTGILQSEKDRLYFVIKRSLLIYDCYTEFVSNSYYVYHYRFRR